MKDPRWGDVTEEEAALLERLRDGVIRYRMEVPVIFMLEATSPLALVGSQALHFLAPVVGTFLPAQQWEQAARLMERREIIERFIVSLETALAGKSQGGGR